jgi:undecaprenyl-diphosphatase
LADVTASQLIKPIVQRQRPEFVMSGVVMRAPSQSSYSFPSNHATNMFAAGTFLMASAPPLGAVILGLAATIAYSRVYVGVHFPADIICGALLGFFWGAGVFRTLYWFGLIDTVWRKHVPRAPRRLRRDHPA